MPPGRRILLVDDSDAVRMTLGALLEELGHHVTEAATLAEARDRLHPALDVAVVDLNLPDGLGSALFDDVRLICPQAALVLLSGADGAAPVGAVDLVLEKGGPPDGLADRIEAAIAARRARS